jgi:hypothetical protein
MTPENRGMEALNNTSGPEWGVDGASTGYQRKCCRVARLIGYAL